MVDFGFQLRDLDGRFRMGPAGDARVMRQDWNRAVQRAFEDVAKQTA